MFLSGVLLRVRSDDEVNWFAVAGFVKGELPNVDAEDESWNPAAPWLADAVASGTVACDPIVEALGKFTPPDVLAVTNGCTWSVVAVCGTLVSVNGTPVGDPGMLDKLKACWDCNEGTVELWDCETWVLVTGPFWTPVAPCGPPVAGTGVMRLWVVVVVIVPVLVTAPAVGILNKDVEVDVVSAVDEIAVVPRKTQRSMTI